jgi:hypothetical protein
MEASRCVSTFTENQMELETPFLAQKRVKKCLRRTFFPSRRAKKGYKRRF